MYYHEITANQKVQFSQQMDLLVKVTQPIRTDKNDCFQKHGMLSGITFDDGYVSVMENALPILFDRNIPCTIFITTGYFGKPPLWITNKEHPLLAEKIMDEMQIKEIARNNLVVIGAHCVTHPNLVSITLEQARNEMMESKTELEKIVGYPIKTFSFPHGSFNQSLIDLARKCGFERVFTIIPGLAFENYDEFATNRVHADPADSLLEIRLKLTGAYRWLPIAFALKNRIKVKR